MQRASAIVSEKLRKYLVEKCHHYRGIIENVRPLPVIVGRVFLHNICQFRLWYDDSYVSLRNIRQLWGITTFGFVFDDVVIHVRTR